MVKFMVSAMSSASGKTTVTCALLEILKRKGLNPCAFKCGPDFVDTMFHRTLLGIESQNLDIFLSSEKHVCEIYEKVSSKYDSVVCEGIMGFYDGVGGDTDESSTWHLAKTLDMPTILVIRPKKQSLTMAAEINGVKKFRKNSNIVGIILNDCAPRLYDMYRKMLEDETGIKVLGYIPPMPEASFEKSHVGFMSDAEIRNVRTKLGVVSRKLEENLDFEKLIKLCNIKEKNSNKSKNKLGKRDTVTRFKLAVAWDKAFSFMYESTIECLEDTGADIAYFSPVVDKKLPEGSSGLYLPSGYPELYAHELSENTEMLNSIKEAVDNGMPVIAEGGGFLYLCKSLQDINGKGYKMVGALPSSGVKTDKMVRYGYATMHAESDSMLFREGEKIPTFEFHYWNSTDNGVAFKMTRGKYNKPWMCGYVSATMYAAFPHIYLAGNKKYQERFADACIKYKNSK